MKKDIKDYLHLYLGCAFWTNNSQGELNEYTLLSVINMSERGKNVQLHLRPLTDMTEDEATYFAWVCMDSRHVPEKDYRISQDEIQIELAKNDGGNLLDGDVEIYIGVSVRCFEGAIIIHKNGSIYLVDENNKQQEPLHDVADKINYLIKQGFDLFGLIESNLAIDKTKPATAHSGR